MNHRYENLLPEQPAHFISGQWSASVKSDDVFNPTTGALLAKVAHGEIADVDKAVRAAHLAQKSWSKLPPPERAQYLDDFAGQIKQHAADLAHLLVSEQGKPLHEAEGEVATAITMLRYYASFGWKRTGHILAAAHQNQTAVTREAPLGVVGAIIPWNYPLALFIRKTAPALVAGNTVVIKPSEVTPLCSLALATLSQRAGLPDGVIGVVCGDGKIVGDALVKHPLTALITMTGSTRAGKEIMKNAAEKVIPVSLELGGKAPFIVTNKADVKQAARDAIDSRMANCGQVCICNERTFVQRGVYNEFIAELKKAAEEKVRVGNPLLAGTTVGPKVSSAEKQHVEELLQATLDEGANILWQAKLSLDETMREGYWVAPTIVTDLAKDARILREEVFGPILPVVVFDTLEEAIELANASEYGLSSYLYTNDLTEAYRIADELEFGEVYINRFGAEEINGFHAGWKMSGIGGDDGEHGYRLYVQMKTIYTHY